MKASTWTAVIIAATVLGGIAAVIMICALINGGHASSTGEIVSCSAILVLAVTCGKTADQLFTRQSALEQWGESLDERKKLLDMRERGLNERDRSLKYWEMISR